MKRLWIILFVLSFANSQNTIAVLDFKGNGILINEASSISERLRTELFNNGDYRVVERDKLEAILKEQGLSQSGIVTDEYIVNAGSILGVDKVVVGTINKIENLYSVSARIVNVKTGEILEAVSYEHSGKLSYLLKTGMKTIAFELLGQKRQEVPSIGIIPLKNKGKEEDAFYAYGISADLISDVSSSGLIRVSSQQDIEKIYTNSLSNDELAEKLNVRYISTGILWKIGELFQISLELYDTKNSKVVWSDRWQEKWDNLPSIKSKLSKNILNNLDILTNETTSSAETGNIEAYEFYLKAKYKYEKSKKTEDVEIVRGLLKKAIDLDKKLANAYHLLSLTFLYESRYDESMEILTNLLKEQSQNNFKSKEIGITYYKIGDVYFEMKDYDKAVEKFSKSSKIADEIDNKKINVYALASLALAFTEKGDSEKALFYSNRTLKLARELDSPRWLNFSYFSFGSYYEMKGDFEMALDYHKRLLNNAQDSKNKSGLSWAHGLIGETYEKMDKSDMALKHYNQSLNLSIEMNNQINIAGNYKNIGEIFYNTTNYEKALENFHMALNTAKTFNNEKLINEIKDLISNAYYDKGDFEEAAKLGHKGAQEKINKKDN
jgi:tetratricopeptide (TPR) repeat protein